MKCHFWRPCPDPNLGERNLTSSQKKQVVHWDVELAPKDIYSIRSYTITVSNLVKSWVVGFKFTFTRRSFRGSITGRKSHRRWFVQPLTKKKRKLTSFSLNSHIYIDICLHIYCIYIYTFIYTHRIIIVRMNNWYNVNWSYATWLMNKTRIKLVCHLSLEISLFG